MNKFIMHAGGDKYTLEIDQLNTDIYRSPRYGCPFQQDSLICIADLDFV